MWPSHRLWIIRLCLALGAPGAWAETVVPLDRPIDVGELTTEAKRLVPSVAGAGHRLRDNTVVFRKEGGGGFTEAEEALLRQALSVHDHQALEKRRAKQQADRANAKARMNALGFSDDEIKALGL